VIVSQTLPSRRIGRTEIKVSELGLGTAPLGNLYEPVTDAQAHSALLAATSAGISYFDTAPLYGFGLSERRVGDGLLDANPVVLSTKVGRLLRPAPEVVDDRERDGFRSSMPFSAEFNYTFDGVMQSWQSSLQRLGLSRVDILYVHDIDRVTHGALYAEKIEELTRGGGWRALEQLRASGAIGAVGLGVNGVEVCLDMLQVLDFDVILLAGRYTLLEQGPLARLFPRCAEQGTSIVVGGPYNSGLLATGTRTSLPLYYNYAKAPLPVVEKVRRLETICDRYDVPLAAAALQFPLGHPQVASVIPGVSSAPRIAQTLEWYARTIPPDFWAALKNDGLIDADSPTPHALEQPCSA
jgi:D-threo-aldose 1-dehydrogenase